MSKEKQLFQSALDVIIDGVAVSTSEHGREEAGRVLLDGVLQGLLIFWMMKK